MSAFGRSSRQVRYAAQTDNDWRTVSRKEPPSKDKACYQCGGPHLARDCPTANESAKKCYRCGGPHLARDCSLPYKSDRFSGSGQRLTRDRKETKSAPTLKPGDWVCPSCGDHQFARNAKCRMCGAAKPAEKNGSSSKDRPAMSSCSTEEDDEIDFKEGPVALPKQQSFSNAARPDSVKSSSTPLAGEGGKPSWADIVDEEQEQKVARHGASPSKSTSAGVSDASSHAEDTPSEDYAPPAPQEDESPEDKLPLGLHVDSSPSEECLLPEHQSQIEPTPAWQQFWEDPMTCAAGNGLANDPGNFSEVLEAGSAAPMDQMVMCGSEWSGMWWPTFSEQAPLQPMQLIPQCPNGHQLVDGVISALDNYICDGCGIKVQPNEHVMECNACNWGLCKRFCCVEPAVLNSGDRVKSLCAEPSWTPRPLQIGDEGVVVENLPDGRVTVEFNGVAGWLYATNVQKLDSEGSSHWPTGGVEAPLDQQAQDSTNFLGV